MPMSLELPIDIRRFVDAADGWIGLGDPQSANEELEQIPPEWKAHPKVLIRRERIYAEFKRWESCREISDSVVALTPGLAEGWINRSFALHEIRRTSEAFDLLGPAADKFPK